MREANFNREIVKSLLHFGAFAYKLGDIPASIARGLRFVPEKPCDILAGYKGKFMGIECKQLKKYAAFGLRHMQPSQIKYLDLMVQTENPAFVFLNIRIAANKSDGIKRENRLLIFQWGNLKDFFNKNGSIKGKDLRKLEWNHPPIRVLKSGSKKEEYETVFDLRSFLFKVKNWP